MARKPAALARELLRNFPKGRRGKGRRKQRRAAPAGAAERRNRDTGKAVDPVALDDVEVGAIESEPGVEVEVDALDASESEVEPAEAPDPADEPDAAPGGERDEHEAAA